ncbi:hypothetical protein [Pseudolysinimonas sp.]|uniref:hypothetical protein n=1 Tax=Pseudolysinimonas sp. TaxID=2680009 RepID=UPI00378328BD
MPAENDSQSLVLAAQRDLDVLFGKDQQAHNPEFTPHACSGLVALILSWVPRRSQIAIGQDGLDDFLRSVLAFGSELDQVNDRMTPSERHVREADRVGIRAYLYLGNAEGDPGTPSDERDRLELWATTDVTSPLMASKGVRGRWAATQVRRFRRGDPRLPVVTEKTGRDDRERLARLLSRDLDAFVGSAVARRRYVDRLLGRAASSSAAKQALPLTFQVPRRLAGVLLVAVGVAVVAAILTLMVVGTISLMAAASTDVHLRPVSSETAAPSPRPSDWTPGWGPERELYENADDISPAFNSRIDGEVGDERNFVLLRNIEDDSATAWSDNVWAAPGQVFQMRVYVTNSAAGGSSGRENQERAIRDPRLSIDVGRREGTYDLYAVLSSENAGTVYDGASIHAMSGVVLEIDETTLGIKSVPFGGGPTNAGVENVFLPAGGRLLDDASELYPGESYVVEFVVRAVER